MPYYAVGRRATQSSCDSAARFEPRLTLDPWKYAAGPVHGPSFTQLELRSTGLRVARHALLFVVVSEREKPAAQTDYANETSYRLHEQSSIVVWNKRTAGDEHGGSKDDD